METLARCGSTSYLEPLWGIKGIQSLLFSRSPLPNVRKRNDVTDTTTVSHPALRRFVATQFVIPIRQRLRKASSER